MVAGCGRIGFEDGEAGTGGTTSAGNAVQAVAGFGGKAHGVSVTLPAPQSAGNTLVAIARWRRPAVAVLSVVDAAGDTFVAVSGPDTIITSNTSACMQVFIASNIAAADTNRIDLALDARTEDIDLRVLEYAGLSPTAPIEATAAQTGTSDVLTTEELVVTQPALLVVGVVSSSPAVAGDAFTTDNEKRGLVESRTVSAGPYTGDAVQDPSGYWIARAVALVLAP